jgi:hypothetical protein
MELMKAQLDLSTLVLTVTRANSKSCERYNIAAIKSVGIEQRKVSKERLFLVNILFKYVGKAKSTLQKPSGNNIYKLEPFLLTTPSSSARLKELSEEMKESLPNEVDFDPEYKPDIHLYLHVNSASGSLEAIYSG